MVEITVGPGQHGDVLFGNVCLGAGDGLTLGYWSDKNGQKVEVAADFVALTALHLRTAAGADQNFTSATVPRRRVKYLAENLRLPISKID